ncbi:unnamed protein product [Brassica napus]|uniref:(rape) hypothetical protein n=1 Tax=Brassica napus TaxID=3708 RepID=A0A816MYD4_BRANA|nr:unnamed protein product [Brassica napus]
MISSTTFIKTYMFFWVNALLLMPRVVMWCCSIMLTETPFRPREKLLEKQRLFQSIQRHTYLKGPMDKVTSVAIPLALAASSLYMIGTGIYNMSNGIGKKE